jgi:hypothetical protein
MTIDQTDLTGYEFNHLHLMHLDDPPLVIRLSVKVDEPHRRIKGLIKFQV